ncbi:MAG TPA: spondin domain-containing protein [Pyrinomonadaceae bacterium]|nr:spondin domain-containing protein [Pyrinomonadaceae bacterium]
MRRRKLWLVLAVLVALAGTAVTAGADGHARKAGRAVKFKVRVENVSAAEGQRAADGTRWPFALSPGLYAVGGRGVALFKAGRRASAGVEAQAEDGNPEALLKSLEAAGHEAALHGVFNTPAGAAGPGPIGPGAAYEFTFSAAPRMKLTLVTMFGQSNDLFYAPDKPIELFGAKGEPLGGDVTSRLVLWDAGTEVDQEPGVGPDQAPRQKAPNTGATQNGVVRRAEGVSFYSRSAELFRVTVTPLM